MFEPVKLREYKDHLRRLADIAIKNNSSNPPLEIFDDAIDRVFDYYYEYEKIMKLCMKPGNELDQHKMAAAFFCAVIKARPIASVYRKNNKTQDDDIENNEREANSECAYKFGKQMIQDHFYYLSTIAKTPEEKIIYDNEIAEPETRKNDLYEQWFYKIITYRAAFHLDFESKHFEQEAVFFVSHIYFMIEKYSYYYNKAKYLETR